MKVLCIACHAICDWPRKAGERLVDYECPKCGGKLQPHWSRSVQDIYSTKEWYGLDGVIVESAKRKKQSVVDMVKDSSELALGVIEWRILDAIQKQGGDYPTYREIGVLTALDLSLITKPLTYLASRDIVQGSHSPDHGGEKVYLLTRKGETVMSQREPTPPIPVAPTEAPTMTLNAGQTLTVGTPVAVADPLPFRCDFQGCPSAFASNQGLSHHKTARKHWNTATGVKPSRIQPKPEPMVEPTVIPPVEPAPKPSAPLVEERKYKCPVFVCDVSCATEEGLERHKETVHPGLCPVCEDDFGSVSSMLIHKGIVHKSKPQEQDVDPVLNIAELLRVDSVDQIAIVKADIEVIDKHGYEYEISINRTGKGLIITKDRAKDLIEALEWQLDMIRDLIPDAKDDDPEWHETLNRLFFTSEFIIEKVRKEANIPKKGDEQDGKEA